MLKEKNKMQEAQHRKKTTQKAPCIHSLCNYKKNGQACDNVQVLGGDLKKTGQEIGCAFNNILGS